MAHLLLHDAICVYKYLDFDLFLQYFAGVYNSLIACASRERALCVLR